MNRRVKYITIALIVLLGFAAHIHAGKAQETENALTPAIPKTWDDRAMAELELPLADPTGSPVHVSADYYYRIPERPLYKSYPVYAPGKEPPGYEEWLKQREPEIAFDASKLKSEEDWIRAGEIVFDAPVFYNAVARVSDVRDPAWYEKSKIPVAKDGTAPFFHYVIREKGKVELGGVSCAMCHTRVMADGTVVKGAQGNYPFELATALSAGPRTTTERVRSFERAFFAAPWVKPDTLAGLDQSSTETIFEWHAAIPPGVIARQGTSPFFPPQVPDLIGIKDRKYLDHTGLQMHRSVVDLMRYAALNQGASDLASFGGFIPAARSDFRTLPDPRSQSRYSDDQLYALALYLYSLRPPANPNRFDALAERGQKVFRAEGCALCHTPPLYTNNKLTPVDGFRVPADHAKRYDIIGLSVGTDTQLALKTRRGTGYYKVPSLRGVWYRGPFEHNGFVMTLEDWFDPRRLRADYVRTGFKGYGVKVRAVKGHEFGLNLSTGDKKALIAFLKTL
ncbi:MAG TPA: di-heme oxidoredictase family protein [Blastocatellia bacterium]|nr:di-heme oxidoredictase family protein [Blastocatellia bacterium]